MAWVVAVLVAASSQAEEAAVGNAGGAEGAAVIQHDFVFPRRREVDGFDLVLHAPQISSWPGFERFAALMAVEVTPPDGSGTRYATGTVQGSTEVDLKNRIVRVIDPQFTHIKFSGGDAPAEYRAAVQHASRDGVLEIPLDLFLASVADEVLSDPPPAGFNVEPPAIAVRSKPALLLFVNGAPVGAAVPGTGLEVLVNANWPLLRVHGDKPRYYLLNRDRWYTSKSLEKGWKQTTELPDGFTMLPDGPEYVAMRAAVPAKKVAGPAPAVLFAEVPTELIVTEGRPRLEEIPGTGGLEYVTNTESPLFKLDDRWYFLASGRWFTTRKLDKGPWLWQPLPPDAFQAIPAEHAAAAVRASVPGTIEAKMAALEASLPTRKSAAKSESPPVEITYAGEPEFKIIEGTPVSRAVNTGYDILGYDGAYYLLYSGIWYQAATPTGPWAVTASVPDPIYAIPPSSPSYHMTQVKVVESTPATVTYSYPSAYTSNTYVVYGVPYYGTGWYYWPYVYGAYYYPYWGSYGYGSWYNSATGRYGSRSVWYGPYGGYSYTQGYNPATGGYGYLETAWDGDEWASHGETYNPRTGVGTETDRYYNADSNTSEMSRTVERGGESMTTERTRDFDAGTSTVERETSRGGSSESQRTRTADGIASEGSITTAGGKEFDVSSEQSRGEGSSTITGAGGSMTTETRRQDGRSVTSIEGSGGGQGISVSGEGPGRTTIGQSGSGDIYAGHNGNVYKKTDDGWMHYDEGGWQPAETPQRGEGAGNAPGTSAEQRPAGEGIRQPDAGGQGGFGQRNEWQGAGPEAGRRDEWQGARPETRQLNRDYDARQRSQRQYEQRRSTSRQGGYQGGGRGGFQGVNRGGFRGGGGRRR